MKTAIHEKISGLRKAKGLTQEQLGAKLGISGQAVSKWEKGESLPDILLLSELCRLLEISADDLLEVSAPMEEERSAERSMQDFLAYSRTHGRTKTLLDVLSRSYNDVGAKAKDICCCISGDAVRVYDENGMGFLLSVKSYRPVWTKLKMEEIAYFLNVLTDENSFAVLKQIAEGGTADKQTICSATGLDEEAVGSALLALMERNIIVFEKDERGSRRYCFGAHMAGIYMALAGCAVTDCGGEGVGASWVTTDAGGLFD